MKRFLLALFISATIAVIVYTVAVSAIDPQAIVAAIRRLTLPILLLILALSLFNYLLRFLRWEYYITHISEGVVPRWRHMLIYVAGFALTTTPGKAGEAVRSIYLKPHGVTYSQSFSALFVERLMDVMIMLILSSLAAIVIDGVRLYAAAALMIVLVLVPSIRMGYLARWARAVPAWMPHRLAVIGQHAGDLLDSSSRLLRSHLLYGGLLTGLVAWAAEGVGFYIVLDALGVGISLPLAISVYAIAVLAGALSFVPGGLGAAEATMGGLLILAGVAKPEAAAATLICRLATLWFAIVLGIVPLMVLTWGRLQSGIHDGGESEA